MTTVAIYVLRHGTSTQPHVPYALGKLRSAVNRLLVVHEASASNDVEDLLEFCEIDDFVVAPTLSSTLAGYRAGLLYLYANPTGAVDALVLTSSAVFSPIGGVDARFTALEKSGAGVLAPYWYDTTRDARLRDSGLPDRLAQLDFALVSGELLRRPAFREFWQQLPDLDNYWSETTVGLARFDALVRAENFSMTFACGDEMLGTADARITEIDALLRRGAPCFPIAALHFDPLMHDLSASNLRDALDFLRASEPTLYNLVVGYALRNIEPRRFAMIADQYEIVGSHYPGQKDKWDFGPIAVFIHAYYTEMMPDFWACVERLPPSSVLYISTATGQGVRDITAFLSAKGLGRDQFVVRKVEQNRGRDMSSLFITFRDIILENRHSVALRLHSKRTPQMPGPVAEEFRKHMFDNLVHSEGFVRNLLDLMEAEPDIGLVIPPVIHIGFTTLGHSWFNNRSRVAELVRDMGLNVRLDEHTPVAPYGTMFWFRTRALRRMFEWGWRWEHYNAEPHHIDGGLAHAQERLIGYCVQDAGYRVVSVMSPSVAARNYAKLEYKFQALASQLGGGTIVDQHDMLREQYPLRLRIYERLRRVYGRILVRYPRSRTPLRPITIFLKSAVFFIHQRKS